MERICPVGEFSAWSKRVKDRVTAELMTMNWDECEKTGQQETGDMNHEVHSREGVVHIRSGLRAVASSR